MGDIRVIRVSEDGFIGRGSYGRVYRINEHQVVKTTYSIGDVIREELGSREPDACRVDEIVRVVEPNGFVRWGVVKPYVPIELPDDWFYSDCGREQREWLQLRNPKLAWDMKPNNCRFMPDGQLVIIDTMIGAEFCPRWLLDM